MKHYLILSSVLSVTACTAHVGYNDLGQTFRSLSYQSNKPSIQQCAFYATKRAAENAEADVAYQQNRLQALKESLPVNAAWNGHTCQKPPVKPLPPEPKSMSHAQAQFQATGACLDLLARRHSAAKIMQSLVAVRQEKLWQTFEEWKKSRQEECALSYMPPQSLDFVVRMCGVFGHEASNSCLMDYMTQCTADVMQTCRASYNEWRQDVANIKAEPDKALQSCQSSLEQIDMLEREIPRLHMAAQLNREEHNKSRRPNFPETSCR